MPPFGVLGRFDPINGQQYWRDPRKHSLTHKRVTCRADGKICPAPVRPVRVTKSQKDKERNLTVTNWVFAETIHVVRSWAPNLYFNYCLHCVQIVTKITLAQTRCLTFKLCVVQQLDLLQCVRLMFWKRFVTRD